MMDRKGNNSRQPSRRCRLAPIGYYITFSAGALVTQPETVFVGIVLALAGGFMIMAETDDLMRRC